VCKCLGTLPPRSHLIPAPPEILNSVHLAAPQTCIPDLHLPHPTRHPTRHTPPTTPCLFLSTKCVNMFFEWWLPSHQVHVKVWSEQGSGTFITWTLPPPPYPTSTHHLSLKRVFTCQWPAPYTTPHQLSDPKARFIFVFEGPCHLHSVSVNKALVGLRWRKMVLSGMCCVGIVRKHGVYA